MATVMNQHTTPMVPPRVDGPPDDKQLRRDRWTAFFIVAVMAALTALIFWLATLDGGVEFDGIDYWEMMP